MWPIWCRVVCTVDGVTFVVSISAAKGKLKPKSIEEFFGSVSGRDDTAKREGLQRTDSQKQDWGDNSRFHNGYVAVRDAIILVGLYAPSLAKCFYKTNINFD
jgi:hypothetical protein